MPPIKSSLMLAKDPDATKKAVKPRSFGGQSRADLQKINSPKTEHGKSAFFNKGGVMKESQAMVKKEVGFMKAKGAPKSMIKHEQAEVKKMASGGFVRKADGIASKGKTKAKQVMMKSGGKC